MAKNQQTVAGDLVVNGDLTVYGNVNQGNILNQINQVIGSVVTKQEADNGYNSTTGGTTTPTAPTVTAYPLYSSIAVQWDAQTDLRWLAYYQLQVSSDQTNWYSLRNDGVDWKGTLNAFTQVSSEYYSHKNIPFGGTTDNPTDVTLYYRVRRVTVSAVQGSWGQSNATTAPIPGGVIAARAVTTAKIQISAITSSLIAAGAITGPKIAVGAITTPKISVSAITASLIAGGSVTAAKIASQAVTQTKLAVSAVTASIIAAGAITNAKLATGAVTTAKVAVSAITTSLLATAAITAAKLKPSAMPSLANDCLLFWPLDDLDKNGDGTNITPDVSGNGRDGIVRGPGWAAFAPGRAGDCAHAADLTSPDIYSMSQIVLNESGATISFWRAPSGTAGAYNRPMVCYTNVANGTDGGIGILLDQTNQCYIYVNGGIWSLGAVPDPNGWHHWVIVYAVGTGVQVYFDGSLLATGPTLSANINLTAYFRVGASPQGGCPNAYFDEVRFYQRCLSLAEIQYLYNHPTGDVPSMVLSNRIVALSVVTRHVTTSAITAIKIAAGAITAAKISASAVTANAIAASAVTAVKIAAASITTAKLATGAVVASIIATGAVTAVKILAGAVTTSALASNSVTTVKITAGAVTATAIAAAAVTATKIAASSVSSGSIQANAVTTAKIAAAAVTANSIATSAITAVKISSGAITTAKLAVGSVTATAIAAGAVTAVKLFAGSVTATAISAGAVTAAKIAASSITSSAIQTGSITTPKFAAGVLNALIAAINSQLVVGPSGFTAYTSTSTPKIGDTRFVVTPTSLSLQWITALGSPNTVDNATWSAMASVGANPSGIEISAILGQVFASQSASLTDVAGDPVPTSSTDYFSLDSVYTNQEGTDPWTTKNNLAFDTGTKKFGTASLKNSPNTSRGELFWSSAVDMTKPFTISGWLYQTGIFSTDALIGASDGTLAGVAFMSINNSGNYLDLYNDAGTAFSVSIGSVPWNTWHFVAMTWNPTTKVLTAVVDANSYNVTGTGSFSKTALDLRFDTGTPSAATTYYDDLLFDQEVVSTSTLIAHYNKNLPWASALTAPDILLRPAPSGRVLIDLLDGNSPAPVLEGSSGYVKFADGTLICYGIAGAAVTTSNASGSIFYAPQSTFTFPKGFIAAPVVVAECYTGTIMTWAQTSLVNTGACAIRIIGSTATSTGTPGYIAIGRWR